MIVFVLKRLAIAIPTLLVLIVLCVILGVRKVKRVRGPQRTIETGKDTVAYLKANTKRS